MRFKTLLMIVLTVLITVICTQNTDPIVFIFLLWQVRVSKVIVLLSLTAFGLIIGLMLGARIGKRKKEKLISKAKAEQLALMKAQPAEPVSTLSDADSGYVED